MTAISEPIVDCTVIKNKIKIHRQILVLVVVNSIFGRATTAIKRDVSLGQSTNCCSKEDNMPPLNWPAGRVLNVRSIKDGKVETVKTITRLHVRPVVKLISLVEMDTN